MRMVDADALVERIVKTTCVPCREKGGDYKGVLCRACQYGDEIDDIASAPTIEGRKTGKWIWQTSDIYRCSECETESHVAECMGEPIYNFCPWCGARMEEGEDNGSE